MGVEYSSTAPTRSIGTPSAIGGAAGLTATSASIQTIRSYSSANGCSSTRHFCQAGEREAARSPSSSG